MTEEQTVLVVKRPGAPADDSILETPPGKPDMRVVVQRWWMQVIVRVARTYLQNLLGTYLTLASGLPEKLGLKLDEFGSIFVMAASFAVAPAVVSLIQNTIELLSSWDLSNPKMRG
jgi:hypothetical protein